MKIELSNFRGPFKGQNLSGIKHVVKMLNSYNAAMKNCGVLFGMELIKMPFCDVRYLVAHHDKMFVFTCGTQVLE